MTNEQLATDIADGINDTDSFYSNLSESLHAAAQVLTVLQLSHDAERIRAMGRVELIEHALNSGGEVERLCVVLGYLQQFVSIRRSSPKLANVDVSNLIADAIDGLTMLYRDGGIALIVRTNDQHPHVWINATKLCQALGGILLIAYETANRGDTVELEMQCTEDSVQLQLRKSGMQPSSIDTDMSLRVAIAEANIRAQGGTFSWRMDPFVVEIGLRMASSEGEILSRS